MVNAQNAQTNGSSIPTTSVHQSAIFAELGPVLEIVKPAIQVMSLLKDNVFQIPTSSNPLKMIFAPHGKTESVLNVPIELISMLMESVEEFQLNVLLGIYWTDCAWLVIMDMTWSKDNVLFHQLLNQPIWDVKFGIGTSKFASNVQQDGPSTQREFVFQFLTIVTNGTLQEPVLLVIKVMNWLKDNVFNQPFNNQLI